MSPILQVRALERRVGDTEILRKISLDVTAGEAIPMTGQLVVRKVAPNGQVSVAVESAR